MNTGSSSLKWRIIYNNLQYTEDPSQCYMRRKVNYLNNWTKDIKLKIQKIIFLAREHIWKCMNKIIMEYMKYAIKMGKLIFKVRKVKATKISVVLTYSMNTI